MRRYCLEIFATFRLAIPLILSQAGSFVMHLIDIAMIGRVGVIPLAAAAFSTTCIGFIMLAGYGLESAVHVKVAQAKGEGKADAGMRFLGQGLWIALLYSAAWSVSINLFIEAFYFLGQDKEVVDYGQSYIRMLTYSMVPVLLYQCLRNFYEAEGRAWVPSVIMALGLALNVLLNWVFIFGNWGAPAMELEGAGLATFIARALIFILLAGHFFGYSGFFANQSLKVLGFCWEHMKPMLAIGIPAGIQLIFEVGMFSVMTVMAGWLGPSVIAAHNMTVNVSMILFMIPLGMSFATTIRVGEAYGAKKIDLIKQVASSSLISAVLFMSLCGALTILFRHQIPLIFIDAESVVKVASVLLVAAAVFQVLEGCQVTINAVLKGMGDVKIPMYISCVNYWLVSVPVGYVFAFLFDWQGLGLWVGICVGMLLSSVVLAGRLVYLFKRQR